MSDLFSNPFRTAPGSAPPALVGRDAELSLLRYGLQMAEASAPPQPAVVIGLRGMGKTVLLRQIEAEARSRKAVAIYVEATRREPLALTLRDSIEGALRRLDSLPARLITTMRTVARYLPKAEYELPNDAGAIALSGSDLPDERKSFEALLLDLNAQAHRHDRILALAIDEIQEASLDDLYRLIKFVHTTAGTSEPAFFAAAGLTDARSHLQKARTYTERFRYLSIGLLTDDDTRAAIREPIRVAGHAIVDDALDRLAAESAGYPFFIQEFASAAWMQHRGSVITVADVDAIIPGVRRSLDDSLYDARFRVLTPRECAYVLALTDLGGGAHTVHDVAAALGATSEAVSSIRNQLVRKDVLTVPSPGLVEFRIPLSDRYVQQHRTELERRSRARPSAAIRSSRKP